MKYDVVLLTEKKYINPVEIDWYTKQVLTEDGLMQEALEKLGLTVVKKDWADPDFDWSITRTALFRATWDYFHRFNEFKNWLDGAASKTILINSAAQIRWNLDKHYLHDLAAKGIPIVESYFIKKGCSETLQEIHSKLGWVETVLKPTISGAARHTYRLNPSTLTDFEKTFNEFIQQEDFVLQPFQHNILIHGEVSFMVLGGKFSHAILKTAKPGDFRVQDDFGGEIHLYGPSPDEIDFATKAVHACENLPFYARVDVVWDNNNQLALSELELIEPELWFRKKLNSAALLAEAVGRFIGDLK
jgi:hypothetical protein